MPADLVRLSCGIEAARGPGRRPAAGDRLGPSVCPARARGATARIRRVDVDPMSASAGQASLRGGVGLWRYLPLVVAVTLLVTLVPLALVALLGPARTPGAVAAHVLLAMAISIALARLAAALWTRHSASTELVFGDLLIWGWARRALGGAPPGERSPPAGAADAGQRLGPCRASRAARPPQRAARDPQPLHPRPQPARRASLRADRAGAGPVRAGGGAPSGPRRSCTTWARSTRRAASSPSRAS